MANMLNCGLGELPLKYLGIPISDKHLHMGAFSPVPEKMLKRLDPWRGKHLTSGEGKSLQILVFLVFLYIVWGFIGYMMESIRKWIVLELIFFGKVLNRNLNIIWPNEKC